MKKSVFLIMVCFFVVIMNMVTYAKNENHDIAVPVIMYHKISDDIANEYCISREQLESDFKELKKEGFSAIGVGDFIKMKEYYEKEETDDGDDKNILKYQNPVLLTFDDGYDDGYNILFGLLKKYNFKANIAIVGSYSENSSSFLSAEEIKEMSESGYVEFGNHSYKLHNYSADSLTTLYNNKENKNIIYDDFMKNEEYIRKTTGNNSSYFAYPYGVFSNITEEVLGDMGVRVSFLTAYSTEIATVRGESERISRINRVPGMSSEELVKLLKQKKKEREEKDNVCVFIKNRNEVMQLEGVNANGKIIITEEQLGKIPNTEIVKSSEEIKIRLFDEWIKINKKNKKIFSKINVVDFEIMKEGYYPLKEMFESINYEVIPSEQEGEINVQKKYRY